MAIELFGIGAAISNMDASDWASWVQAVGSMLAIYFSIKAVNRAHRLEVTQRKQEGEAEYTKLLSVVCDLITATWRGAKIVRERETEGNVQPRERKEWASAFVLQEHALSQINVDRFDRYEFIAACMVTRIEIRRLIDEIEEIGAGVQKGPYDLRGIANIVANVLEEQIAVLQVAIRNRGGPVRSESKLSETPKQH
jgi:hypothetical protein